MFSRKPRAAGVRIAVLGVGPSGVFAAMAARELGANDITMIARSSSRSPIYGAQYLHQPIPGTESSRRRGDVVAYNLLGTAEGYRSRVYSDSLPDSIPVSADSLVGTAPCWDLRSTYSEAFSLAMEWHSLIEADVNKTSIAAIASSYDIVVSTVPATALCSGRCTFASQEVWAAGEAPEIGIKLSYNCEDMSVFCNGLPARDGPSWYRVSNLYGRKTIEWPGDSPRPPIRSVARIHKPLFNNCSCPPPNVVRVGRYGAWHKGILAHDAYLQAWNAIKEMTR